MTTDHTTPPDNLAGTQKEEKIRVMQQILATDTAALSLPETVARNNIDEDEIRDLLTELQNHDPPLITTISPDEPAPKHYPDTYFAVSEHGINSLKEAGLYNQIGILYGAYDAADITLPDDMEVTIEEIENWQHRPTPDWL